MNQIRTFLLLICLFFFPLGAFSVMTPVHASTGYQTFFNKFGGAETGGNANQSLNTYQGLFSMLSQDAAGNNLPAELVARNAVLYVVSLIVWFISAVAVIFIIIAGVKVVTDPSGEDAVKKQLTVIRDIAVGIVVMHSANFIVAGIYTDPTSSKTDLVKLSVDPATGDKILETTSPYIMNFRDATSPIKVSEKIVYPLMNYFFSFVAAFAVLFIVVSTFRIITSQGDPEKVKAARQGLINTAFGLLVIILAQYFVKAVYGLPTSTKPRLGPDVAYALTFLMSISNYLLGFMAFLGVLMLLYAGALIISSGVTPDNKKKGIEIVKRTLMGIIITVSSYAVISTIVRLGS